MRSARIFASALTAATLLTVTACGGDSGGSSGGSGGGDGDAPKIAAVFSGTTTDADYTFLGLQALQSAEKEFGATTSYSESVAVPDAEREAAEAGAALKREERRLAAAERDAAESAETRDRALARVAHLGEG